MQAHAEAVAAEQAWRIDPEGLNAIRASAIQLSNRLATTGIGDEVEPELVGLIDAGMQLIGPAAIDRPLLAGTLSANLVELAKASGRLSDPEFSDRVSLNLQSIVQVLDEVEEGLPAAMAEVDAKSAVRWLAAMLKPATQAEIAAMIGVGERALQHWLSPNEASAPSGPNLDRLRHLLLLAGRLRPMFTADGFAEWIRRPIPGLAERSPGEALETEDGFSKVMRIAAQLRAI